MEVGQRMRQMVEGQLVWALMERHQSGSLMVVGQLGRHRLAVIRIAVSSQNRLVHFQE
jgi:hypothetical protein